MANRRNGRILENLVFIFLFVTIDVTAIRYDRSVMIAKVRPI